MKHTRHLCDFCGGRISDGDGAVLRVPMTPDEQRIAKRVHPERSRRVDDWRHLMFGGLVDVTTARERTFDMCRGCVDGLLRARLATLASLREAVKA